MVDRSSGFKSCTLLCIVVLHLVLHMNPSCVYGCIERERQALLAFKKDTVDKYNRLSSWGSSEDCCRWAGVWCSNQTGNILELDLRPQNCFQAAESVIQPLKGTISSKLIELQHLEYLDLSCNELNHDSIRDSIGSLRKLRYLDLSYNLVNGPFPYQIGNLTNLEYLDLSSTYVTKIENFNWLSHLTSLRELKLSSSNLSTAFDWLEAVNRLPELRVLELNDCDLPPPVVSCTTLTRINYSQYLESVDLSNNQLNSTVLQWLFNHNVNSLVRLSLINSLLSGSVFDVFRIKNAYTAGFSANVTLCSLQELQIGMNNISGQLSDLLHMLFASCPEMSLESLDLSDNHLEGSMPNLSNFSSLKELYLEGNRLTGRLPESIGQMSNLEVILLGGNSFTGEISDIHFSKLSKLIVLSLSSNSFTGEISEIHFSKLSKLRRLDLSYNSFIFNFDPGWIPPFQLISIRLASCKIGPHLPEWLRTQKRYSDLDISNAGISGILPSWFWGQIPLDLGYMDLSHNQIGGKLFPNSVLEGFTYNPLINMSSNQFEGPVPSVLSKVSSLDLSNNKLSGSISFLCPTKGNYSKLTLLSLASNHLIGDLPDCWTPFKYLLFLDLSSNAFSGKIPTTIGSLLSLKTLKLNNNRFVGELPSSLGNCRNLRVCDVGENNLSGLVPGWLGGGLANLMILILRSNQFNGSMPSQLCHLKKIQILDFSINNISGFIPKCLHNFTSLAQNGFSATIAPSISEEYSIIFQESWGYFLKYDDEASLIWKGTMWKYKSILGLVKSIDLSCNRLTGEIPSEIRFLVGLVSLNLSRNQLTGTIPREIGSLQSLDSLDLSRNHLYGRIPSSLSRISRLSVLDLSDNNLSGMIPIGTQIQSFEPTAFDGNPLLCGPPLPRLCSDHAEKTGEEEEEEEEEGKDELITQGFYISMALGFVVGFYGVIGPLLFK